MTALTTAALLAFDSPSDALVVGNSLTTQGLTSTGTSSEVAPAADAQHSATPLSVMPGPRVRGATRRLEEILGEASARSDTFRQLVERINRTDGIVYVAEGPCGSGLKACLLLTLTLAGQNRLLRIHVAQHDSDAELMAAIGHELQHAVEVLNDQSVRSGIGILMLYRQQCQICGAMCHRCGGPFETEAAVVTGQTVAAELKKSTPTAAAGIVHGTDPP